MFHIAKNLLLATTLGFFGACKSPSLTEFRHSDTEKSSDPVLVTSGNIFEPDDRIPHGTDGLDLGKGTDAAIGRVSIKSSSPLCGGICTGTLTIDRIHVITAGHCFVDPKKEPCADLDITFQANYLHGAVADDRDNIPAKLVVTGDADKENEDWAVLRLQYPPDDAAIRGLPLYPLDFTNSINLFPNRFLEMTGYFGGLFPVDEGRNKAKVQLPRGKRDEISEDHSCSVKSLHQVHDLLLTTCDSSMGSSGAPLIAFIRGRRFVVAINKGAFGIDGKNLRLETFNPRFPNTAVKVDAILSRFPTLKISPPASALDTTWGRIKGKTRP